MAKDKMGKEMKKEMGKESKADMKGKMGKGNGKCC